MSGHVISKHGLNIMMSVPDVLANTMAEQNRGR